MSNCYLRRSHHIPDFWRSILKIYLAVLSVTLCVVALIYLCEPTTEIINGLPPFADDPLPGVKAIAAERKGWFGEGFVGFVRLVPVSDKPERQIKPPLETYSIHHDTTFPASYSPVFDEDDLMSRLRDDSTDGYGLILYTITSEDVG